MTPEYLEQLADLADPHQLWRLPVFAALSLPPDQRVCLDAGVALRRYAEHMRQMRDALDYGRSLLYTPLSENASALRVVDTPPEHQRLRR